MDVWLRVLMAVLLMLAPSVLFVLLCRGLVRLQDQELIARLARAGHLDPASIEGIDGTDRIERREQARDPGLTEQRTNDVGRNAGVSRRRAAFLREHERSRSHSTKVGRDHGDPSATESGEEGVVRCENCGRENTAAFGLCWHCLEWLD